MSRQAPHTVAAPAQHAPLQEYLAFLDQHYPNPATRRVHRRFHARFLAAYPDLGVWFAAPLTERIGRRPGARLGAVVHPVSYAARPYLYFLAWRGYATFDWDWLIAIPDIHLRPLLEIAGLADSVDHLIAEAGRLGYRPRSAENRMTWIVYRLLLHHGFFPLDQLSDRHCREVVQAVQAFGQRPDAADVSGSSARYRRAQSL